MKSIALTVLALVAFAGNSLLCRLAVADGAIDPASFSVLRFASGAAALLLIVRLTRRTIAWGRDWRPALILAAYAVPFSVAYTGLTAATGALLLFGAVQVTMLAAGLARGEAVSHFHWLGLITACCGLLYLVWPGVASPPVASAVLMTIAGVGWGLYSLMGRGSTDPVADTARNFVHVSPLLLLAALVGPTGHASVPGVTFAVLSGVFASGVGYVAWYAVLHRLSAARAGVLQLSVPLLATAGGAYLLREPISLRLLIATAFVIGGIGMTFMPTKEQ